MKRKAGLLLGALAGAAAAVVLRGRRTRQEPEPPGDPRAEELRRKLVEARQGAAAEDEFEAAGMGAETIVEADPAPPRPPSAPARPAEPPPRDEFEAMRRRVHEEGRAAAREMRGEPDSDS